jgi:hypothetical protein
MSPQQRYQCGRCSRRATTNAACESCGHHEVFDLHSPADRQWLEAVEAMRPSLSTRIRSAVVEHRVFLFGFAFFGASIAALLLSPATVLAAVNTALEPTNLAVWPLLLFATLWAAGRVGRR